MYSHLFHSEIQEDNLPMYARNQFNSIYPILNRNCLDFCIIWAVAVQIVFLLY